MRYLTIIVAIMTWNAICSTGRTTARKFNRDENAEENLALNFVVRSANEFSLILFQKLALFGSNNIILAPSEYFISLSMAPYEISTSSLQKSPKNALLAILAAEKSINISLGLGAFVNKIDSYRSSNFTIDNKIFYHMDFEPRPEFKAAAEHNPRLETEALDFNNLAEASGIINRWLKNTTQDSVSDLIESDDLKTGLSVVISNVISFKASWIRPFTLIGDRVFHANSTKQVKMPFMRQLYFFEHGQLSGLDAQFIRIPYEINGSENEISMFIILPNKIDGIRELKQNIAELKLVELRRGKLSKILLSMPKFKYHSKFTITKPLKNDLFMETFMNVANHSGSSEFPLKTSKFSQRVYIEVDEKSEFQCTDARDLPGTRKLIVNRPFIFIISTTGRNPVILFIGCYMCSQNENVNHFILGDFDLSHADDLHLV